VAVVGGGRRSACGAASTLSFGDAHPTVTTLLFLRLLLLPLAFSATPSRHDAATHDGAPRVSAVSVSKGEDFACAITSPGALVYCWGSVEGDVLGIGVSDRHAPTRVAIRGLTAGDSIVAVSAGATPFACALAASGAAQCWGANEEGEIGDGSMRNVRPPTRVRVGEPLASISAGENMACGLTRDGRAFCWGINEDGQLGAGDSAVHHLPVPVKTRYRFRRLSVGAAGGTCGVLVDSRLLCWGRNDGGQLGTADDSSVVTPRVPRMLAAERFSTVSVGNGFACAVTTDARLLCWGSADELFGRQAVPAMSVVEMRRPAADQVVAIESGFKSLCALAKSHRVYCAGSNVYGELGRVATSTFRALAPIASEAEYAALSLGAFGCAVTADRALDCWGSQRKGRARRAAEESRVVRMSFE